MNEEGIDRGNFGSGVDLFSLLSLRTARVVMGRVDSEGLKLQGHGFRSACHSDGSYSVWFNEPFRYPPIVMVSVVNDQTDLSATLYLVENDKFELVTAEVGRVDSWPDRQFPTEFMFVAFGVGD